MISIIVPYYNAAPWIGRCCNSMSNNQGDFEFVMVNDASVDGSEQIVSEYARKDERFVMLDNEHTKGVSGARNTGLDHAAGEWLAFLDADDEQAPDAMRAFKTAQRVQGFDMFQFNHWRYYEPIDKLTTKYRNCSGVFTAERLPLCFAYVWNKLYKAEILQTVRFDETVSYCEDELFNFEVIAKTGRLFSVEEETVIKHYENPNSLSKVATADQLFIQTEKMADFIKRQTNPLIKCAACLKLSELWQSTKYLEIIGERSKGGE